MMVIPFLMIGIRHVQDMRSKLSVDNANVPILVLLTDGKATGKKPARIVRDSVTVNKQSVAIYALAFGSNADMSLLNALTTLNGGATLRVYEGYGDSVVQMQTFFRNAVGSVQMRDISFAVTGAEIEHATRLEFPVLSKGSEIMVTGKINLKRYDNRADREETITSSTSSSTTLSSSKIVFAKVADGKSCKDSEVNFLNGQANIKDVEICKAMCMKNMDCVAVTYWKSKYCSLFGKFCSSPSKKARGAVSYKKINDPFVKVADGTTCEDPEVNYLGAQANVIDVETCKAICMKDKDCVAITYWYWPGEYCRYYSKFCSNPRKQARGAVSYILGTLTTKAPRCTMRDGKRWCERNGKWIESRATTAGRPAVSRETTHGRPGNGRVTTESRDTTRGRISSAPAHRNNRYLSESCTDGTTCCPNDARCRRGICGIKLYPRGWISVDRVKCGSTDVAYILKTSGNCSSGTEVTSLSECSAAGKYLARRFGWNGVFYLKDQRASDDNKYSVPYSYNPSGCYQERGLLMFNGNGKNTGGCDSIDRCLCRKATSKPPCFLIASVKFKVQGIINVAVQSLLARVGLRKPINFLSHDAIIACDVFEITSIEIYFVF